MLVGGGLDVGVHLDAPGLAQVALAHADRSHWPWRHRARIGGRAGAESASSRTQQAPSAACMIMAIIAALLMFMSAPGRRCPCVISPLRWNSTARDDDDAGQHQAAGLGDGVDAEDLFQVADGQRAEQRQADAAAPAHQAGAADDDDGDGGQLVADARLPGRPAVPGRPGRCRPRRRSSPQAVGQHLGRRRRARRKAAPPPRCRRWRRCSGPSDAGPGRARSAATRSQEDQRDHGDVAAEDPRVDGRGRCAGTST